MSPNEPFLKDNLVLSRRLASMNLSNPTNLNEVVFVLQTNAQRQARAAEALNLSRNVSKTEREKQDRNNKLLASWRAQLKAGGIPDKQIETLGMAPDGTATLDLIFSPITNLSGLAGIPLSHLVMYGTKVRSLEPLRGMPLKHLSAGLTQIDDLRPLSGMPLEFLNVQQTQVRDLSPLKGMKLRTLDLQGGQKIADYSPLEGMPLDSFSVSGAWMEVPTSVLNSVMKEMPLKSSLNLGNITNLKDITFLKNKPVREYLDLMGTKVSDLGPLAGKSIHQIVLISTQVRDLSPLHSVEFEILFLHSTPVADLTPLAGTLVKELQLQACVNLKDVSPLAQCTKLERLCIPFGVGGVDKLRDHPNLEKITYNTDFIVAWDKVPPVADFWKAHDARKGKKK